MQKVPITQYKHVPDDCMCEKLLLTIGYVIGGIKMSPHLKIPAKLTPGRKSRRVFVTANKGTPQEYLYIKDVIHLNQECKYFGVLPKSLRELLA